MNTKMTLLAALLAATALAPAAAVAQNRHDRGDRGRHERSDHAHERSQPARHEARTVRADRPERVMPARAPRTITPPRSTAPRSHVTVRSASEARATSATDRYNAARAQRQDHDRRTWDRSRSDDSRRDWNRGHDDNDRHDRGRDDHRADRNRGDHDWNRNDHDWRGDRGDRYDRYRQAQRRYQNRVDQARDRYDFHDRARWNRDWRSNHRYDWRDYRTRNRQIYRLPRYYAPRGYDYGYHRFSIGLTIGSILYQDQYWINDPGYYRLPPAYGPYRWVRYYNDALLVDIRSGMVVDVIYDIFW